MADTGSGAVGVRLLLGGVASGFAFGASSLAVGPAPTEDGLMLNPATAAAGRVGSTGVGVVTACLVLSNVLLSVGISFLLAAVAMKLLTAARMPWLAEAAAGASVVSGAVAAGVFAGILPPWLYLAAQGVLVLVAFSHSDISDIATGLLVIFTTLYLSVLCGRMGVIAGVFLLGLTIVALRALTQRLTPRQNSPNGCQLLERISFYSIAVGILGFFVGLGAGRAGEPSEEVALMLQSVLWVAFVSAGLIGAGLGAVAMVGLGLEAAGKVAVVAAMASTAALTAIIQSSSLLGEGGTLGGTLGAAAAAGVSLGAMGVAAKQAFDSRSSTLAVLGSVAAGAILAVRLLGQNASPLPTTREFAVAFVAVWAFVLGAPRSPFNTEVNLRRGLLTGAELMNGIGMETVTAAAAPFGTGALGAAVLGTAALGRLGTVGVMAAVVLALGKTLMLRQSQATTNAHSD